MTQTESVWQCEAGLRCQKATRHAPTHRKSRTDEKVIDFSQTEKVYKGLFKGPTNQSDSRYLQTEKTWSSDEPWEWEWLVY